jgi:hypothetical protein
MANLNVTCRTEYGAVWLVSVWKIEAANAKAYIMSLLHRGPSLVYQKGFPKSLLLDLRSAVLSSKLLAASAETTAQQLPMKKQIAVGFGASFSICSHLGCSPVCLRQSLFQDLKEENPRKKYSCERTVEA